MIRIINNKTVVEKRVTRDIVVVGRRELHAIIVVRDDVTNDGAVA